MPASAPARMAAWSTEAGRLGTVTERAPEAWLARVERDGHGIVETETLAGADQGDEFLMMGLRLSRGHRPRALRRAEGPAARSGADRRPRRRRPVARLPDGRIAATAGRRPGAQRRGGEPRRVSSIALVQDDPRAMSPR